MDKKLKEYLKDHKIDYIIHNHPAVFTVEQSKSLNLSLPCAHTKNLFLKDENKNYYLICTQADKRLNLKQLKKSLNVSELHFGSPDELKENLKITPGSVSLFNIINSKSVMLILDSNLLNSDKIGFHPNINTSTLEITRDGLHKFYKSLKSKKEVINLE